MQCVTRYIVSDMTLYLIYYLSYFLTEYLQNSVYGERAFSRIALSKWWWKVCPLQCVTQCTNAEASPGCAIFLLHMKHLLLFTSNPIHNFSDSTVHSRYSPSKPISAAEAVSSTVFLTNYIPKTFFTQNENKLNLNSFVIKIFLGQFYNYMTIINIIKINNKSNLYICFKCFHIF